MKAQQSKIKSNDEYLSGLLEDVTVNGSESVTTTASAPKSPSNPNSTSGVYRKIETSDTGTKYTPSASSDLPEQYQTYKWKCPSCASVHTSALARCNLCGTQKSTNHIVKDENATAVWSCSSCKVENTPGRTTCIMCGTKYKPTAPAPSPGALKTNTPDSKKKANPQALVSKKKQIVSKAGAGIELQYAKGLEMTYKSGTTAIPGHGAGY